MKKLKLNNPKNVILNALRFFSPSFHQTSYYLTSLIRILYFKLETIMEVIC